MRPRAVQSVARRRPEIFAGLVGVLVVLLIAAALHGLSDTQRSPAKPRGGARTSALPRTASGAVRAATAYLVAFNDLGALNGASARKTVAAIVVGPLRDKLKQALPLVVAQIHARLGRAPSAFDGWPLGYRV